MINYSDSEIMQIMPNNLKELPEVIAISYAIKNSVQMMYRYSQRIRVYADIDSMPEQIIDLLAQEMRCQYYSETFDLDKKKKTIKKSLLWYYRAGTPSAVNELIKVAFGKGSALEWYKYDGNPYEFVAQTLKPDFPITEEGILIFQNAIHQVKNARSHLVKLEFVRESQQRITLTGAGSNCYQKRAYMTDDYQIEESITQTICAGIGIDAYEEYSIK